MSCHQSSIRVALYCDEIANVRLHNHILGGGAEYWDYIGILTVPVPLRGQLLQCLLDARCLNPDNDVWEECESPCGWHDDNNTEIHYADLDDTRKYKVACSWIDFLIRNAKSNLGLVYFYILGLNRSKLNLDRFGAPGSRHVEMTVYNRFFRTAVQKATKVFFHQYETIFVDDIYHDKGPGEEDSFFPWHAPWRLGWQDEKLSFGRGELTFINSDHRASDGDAIHSHFIQFIDLILGCTFNMLHYASESSNKVNIALRAKDLLGDRLIRNPNNKQSSYHYFGCQRIEFFPRQRLDPKDEGTLSYEFKRRSSFYTLRELRIEERVQPPLPGLASP